MIVSMRSISISHVWFTFILSADQVEVASTQSLQGIDIQQSDVTILQGHTSEVWFIKKFSIDLWLCFALYDMMSQLRIVSMVFHHSTDEDYIYYNNLVLVALCLVVSAAILSLKALHVSDLHKFSHLLLTNQFYLKIYCIQVFICAWSPSGSLLASG